MMRSLTLKLTIAFLTVSVIGTVLVAIFVRQTTQAEFDRYLLEEAQSDFVGHVSDYYQHNGSWEGIALFLNRNRPGQNNLPADNGDNNLPPPPPPIRFFLVDKTGTVVVPAGARPLGDRLTPQELEEATPIKLEEDIIGYVLPDQRTLLRDPEEARYLARTNQALLFATVGATIIAVLIGILLARMLTRPVRELTAATEAMSQGQLEQKVPIRSQDELGQLAASFNQMSMGIARANQLRRQMTADIAHDLRSPLSVIRGYTEALSDGVLNPTPEMFQTMHHETELLSSLIEDLRTLSLADAGELKLNRQSVSVGELLEQAVATYQSQAEQKRIALRAKIKPSLPPVEVDPERFARVLGNLVNNALRYTPEGGQVTLTASDINGRVQMKVKDSGSGIGPEQLPYIFERFYRGDSSREQHNGESGLGLAIARSIVEAHGGTIEAESTEGKGTTFIIQLPA